jgi:hypothetical protein
MSLTTKTASFVPIAVSLSLNNQLSLRKKEYFFAQMTGKKYFFAKFDWLKPRAENYFNQSTREIPSSKLQYIPSASNSDRLYTRK